MNEPYLFTPGCTWHGPISSARNKTLPETLATIGGTKVKIGGPGSQGIPVCPHCGCPTLMTENAAAFWAGVEAYQEQRPCPGYVTFVRWVGSLPRCLPSMFHAAEEYKAVDPSFVMVAPEPERGAMSTCDGCGFPVEYNGQAWEHANGRKTIHRAKPSTWQSDFRRAAILRETAMPTTGNGEQDTAHLFKHAIGAERIERALCPNGCEHRSGEPFDLITTNDGGLKCGNCGFSYHVRPL